MAILRCPGAPIDQITETVLGRFASSAALAEAARKVKVHANRLVRDGLLKRYVLGKETRYSVTEAGCACCAKYGTVEYPASYA